MWNVMPGYRADFAKFSSFREGRKLLAHWGPGYYSDTVESLLKGEHIHL